CSRDEAKLRRHDVDDRAEAGTLRELERGLGFPLHLREWICARETIRDECVVRIGSVLLIAGFQRGLQAAAEQRNGRSNMPPPGIHHGPATEVHTSLE